MRPNCSEPRHRARNRDWFQGKPFVLAHADNLTDFRRRRADCGSPGPPARPLMTMLLFGPMTPNPAAFLSSMTAKPWWPSMRRSPIRRETWPMARSMFSNPKSSTLLRPAEPGRGPIDRDHSEVFGENLSVETNGYHRDIGNPEALSRARAEFGQRADTGAAGARHSVEIVLGSRLWHHPVWRVCRILKSTKFSPGRDETMDPDT